MNFENRLKTLEKKQRQKEKLFLENKEYNLRQIQLAEERNKMKKQRRDNALEFVRKLEKDKVRNPTITLGTQNNGDI